MVNATGKTYKFTPKKIIIYLFIYYHLNLFNKFCFYWQNVFQITGWRFVNDQPTLEKAKLIRTIFNP